MLTRPDLSDRDIAECLQASFGLQVAQVSFLPINLDLDAAVFQVTASHGVAYFLKLRRQVSDDTPVRVAAFLHAQGISAVMAPIPTMTGELSVRARGFTWLLYPFFAGRTALQAGLSVAQWIALGACMRAVHATALPAELAQRVAREGFAPHWRREVESFPARLAQQARADPSAAHMAALWAEQRDAIERVQARAEQLAHAVEGRPFDPVLCHSDLHANNVLVGDDGELAVIDWDEPILAPRERDLMFIGGGVGGAWNRAEETAWFYEGYGPAPVDEVALAYYRYERIVEDFAGYGARVLGRQGSVEDRAEGLRRLANAFQTGNVVEMAAAAYPYAG